MQHLSRKGLKNEQLCNQTSTFLLITLNKGEFNNVKFIVPTGQPRVQYALKIDSYKTQNKSMKDFLFS